MQLADCLSPVQLAKIAGILANWTENLHAIVFSGPAQASQASTFLQINFASEQNGPPVNQYFTFCITYKRTADNQATNCNRLKHKNAGLARVESLVLLLLEVI